MLWSKQHILNEKRHGAKDSATESAASRLSLRLQQIVTKM